jgi:hypothetical protein
MAELALIISIIALYLAFMAYQKVGGLGDRKKQSEALTQIGDALIKATNSLREKTADVLDKLETSLRTKETTKETGAPTRKETPGEEEE